jgi:hypothetical protein
MMPEGHGLRRLQMGEARHDGARMFFGARQQRFLEVAELAIEMVDRVADIELEVGRHLVVARAGGVKPARRRADEVGKPRFHVHVDVFEVAPEFELVPFDFGQHRVETRDNVIGIRL